MAHYITVTLQISGYDEGMLLLYQTDLRELLRQWKYSLTWGELHISYQDQAQIEHDAQLDPDDQEAWPI